MTTDALIAILIVALASARVAVLFVHDAIFDKPRDWFFRQWPPFDNPMHGYEYQSRDKEGNPLPASLKRDGHMFSELFTCTRCLTVWTTVPAYFAFEAWGWAAVVIKIAAAMAIASWSAKKL